MGRNWLRWTASCSQRFYHVIQVSQSSAQEVYLHTLTTILLSSDYQPCHQHTPLPLLLILSYPCATSS